jgi:hypothetical protein
VVAAKETAFDELMILIETIDNSRGERVMQCLAVDVCLRATFHALYVFVCVCAFVCANPGLLLPWGLSDMVKMGGLGPVSACLASAAPSLRAMAAETLATALQNNPAVQQMAASANLLAVFLPMVARDPDITVRTKVGWGVADFRFPLQPPSPFPLPLPLASLPTHSLPLCLQSVPR